LSGDGEKATLYPSRAALEEVSRQGAAEVAKGPIDLTRTLLPPIADFLRGVEGHAKSVGNVLRIPDEALDFTDASLDAVDAALKRIRPAAKRMTPEVVTPLVAYVGEVMLRVCGGRWTPGPTTRKKSVPVFDPTELSAWQELYKADVRAAQEKAAAPGAPPGAAAKVYQDLARSPKYLLAQPKPIRFDVIEERIHGHENEPMITARHGRLLGPFALVVIPMVEPSKRLALRAAVGVTVMAYRPGFQAGPPGTLLNPAGEPMPPG
jgi:hypothetical protein